jgi:hypothetical protein
VVDIESLCLKKGFSKKTVKKNTAGRLQSEIGPVSKITANTYFMKQILRFLFIAFFLLLQAQLFANTVIVKGTVKDSANHPIANKTVKIYSTDSTQGCALSHTVITNANGYYIDTLTCNGKHQQTDIIVENCNGTKDHTRS